MIFVKKIKKEFACMLNMEYLLSTAWMLGDPHFQTLDSVRYTFNGLGEYTLLSINDDEGQVFTVQGRTERILDEESETLGLATKFVGFAAQVRDSYKVI